MKGRLTRILAWTVLLACLGQGSLLTSWAYTFHTGCVRGAFGTGKGRELLRSTEL